MLGTQPADQRRRTEIVPPEARFELRVPSSWWCSPSQRSTGGRTVFHCPAPCAITRHLRFQTICEPHQLWCTNVGDEADRPDPLLQRRGHFAIDRPRRPTSDRWHRKGRDPDYRRWLDGSDGFAGARDWRRSRRAQQAQSAPCARVHHWHRRLPQTGCRHHRQHGWRQSVCRRRHSEVDPTDPQRLRRYRDR
jgi:hypothetical protein